MPEIQTADPGRKLQVRYDLAGTSPAPSLSPEIVPVTIVDDLTEFSTRDATFERPCFAYEAPTAAGVGFYPSLHFANPVGSGVLAVVERVLLNPNVPATVVIQQLATTAGALTADLRRFRDSRVTGNPVCGVINAALPLRVDFDMQFWSSGADPRNMWMLPEILSPGWGLRFYAMIDNGSLALSIWWRERTLLSGEL